MDSESFEASHSLYFLLCLWLIEELQPILSKQLWLAYS